MNLPTISLTASSLSSAYHFEFAPSLFKILCIYAAVISLISMIVCIYDKSISKKNKVELRVPEKTLMLLSAIGGGVAMYVTMLIIRHKTKHVKFMLGIPVFILLHAALVIAGFYFGVLAL